MTLNQLLSEVYALGFEDEGELDESFVFSVRRALKMIFTELAPAVRGKIVINEDSAKELDLRKHFEKFKQTAQTSLLDMFTEQPQTQTETK